MTRRSGTTGYVDAGQAPLCEVCAAGTEPWQLGRQCVLWRCPECQHVVRDLAMCRAGARAHAWGGDRDLDVARLMLTHRRIVRSLHGNLGRSVFEVGFGSGELLARFLNAGCEVAGVDTFELEKPVDPRLVTSGQLFSGELESLPDTAASYDLVYGVHVLEHLRDPALALRRCRELLVPGGRVYFLTPTASSGGPRVFGSSWWLLEDPTHLRFFSPESLHRALRSAGFTDVVIRAPLLDNLSMEVCSTIRMITSKPSEHGVLAHRVARVMSILGGVPAVLGRLAWPRLRPTLEVTARAW